MACTSESIVVRIANEDIRTTSLLERLAGLWYRLECWRERSRQRSALLALDDHLLRDIGLSRGDAEREGRKPFWAG